jgi:hypothetical protein
MEDGLKHAGKAVSAGVRVDERVSLTNKTDKVNYIVPEFRPTRTLPGGIVRDTCGRARSNEWKKKFL